MSHLVRTGKSGSDWTDYELTAFNILIQDVDTATFFGVPHLPPVTVSPVILNNILVPWDMPQSVQISDKDDRCFEELDDAIHYDVDNAAVNQFTQHILRMLNFESNRRMIVTRRERSFIMCGTTVSAMVGVSVFKEFEGVSQLFSLLIQAEKRTVDEKPIAQLIAAVIAAFVQNSSLRASSPLLEQTFPAMTMVGPCPVFYKIPITQALVNAIGRGEYPAQPTVVQRLVPPVPNPNTYRWHGMVSLEHRRVVFQCLEALKKMLQ